MEKKKLILVGNTVDADWAFRQGVEDATGSPWDVKTCVINQYNGIKKYTRYLNYFIGPFMLFLQRNRYSHIVSWEQFLGLVTIFFMRLFRVKHPPKMTIMALIYKPKKGLIGRVFEWFVRYTAASDYVHRIIVYSQSEVDYYAETLGIPKEKFATELLGVADRPDLRSAAAEAQAPYYVAAGRSNRDYDFLRAAWPKDEADLLIICDVEKNEDQDNIRYLKNCHGDEYLRLLSGCHAALVPLKSEKFSSGQLVFLQAAMMGKPVITTPNDTVPDYVDEGDTGFIINKTAEDLAAALKQLKDPAQYQRMSQNARHAFETRFSLHELGRRVGQHAVQ